MKVIGINKVNIFAIYPTNTARVFHIERRGNGRFYVVSTWNTRDVFAGYVSLL